MVQRRTSKVETSAMYVVFGETMTAGLKPCLSGLWRGQVWKQLGVSEYIPRWLCRGLFVCSHWCSTLTVTAVC